MDVGSSGTELLLGIEECEHLKNNGSFTEEISLNYSVSGLLFENSTIICLDHAPVRTRAALIRACVLGVLAVLSLIANAATIYSIRRSQRARRFSRTSCSAIYSLILQLSVADLLVTVFCLAGEAAWSYTVAWLAGNVACKIFKFSQMFSLYLSTFVLVLVGVDRFVAVRFPMKNLSTGSRGTGLVAIVWVLSAVFSIPQAIVFHEARGPFVEEFYQCVTHGSYSADWQEQLYAILSLILMFILPLIILMITYAATFVTISKSEKVFRTEVTGRRPDLNRRRLIHRAKMKSLRISVVIVVAFVLWWTPYYSMMIIFIFLDPGKHLSEDLQSAIFFFGMSNSLVNPIIYGAFQLWPGSRKRRRSHSRDFSTSTRMTQASMIRSTARVMDRNRIQREPESAALVTMDRDQIITNKVVHSNGVKSNANNHQPQLRQNGSTNGVVSSHQEHTLLTVPSDDAVTRV